MSLLSLFVAKKQMMLMMNKRLPSSFVLCWCKGDGGIVEGDRQLLVVLQQRMAR